MIFAFYSIWMFPSLWLVFLFCFFNNTIYVFKMKIFNLCINISLMHPSGFQSAGAVYNCVTCQYDSCEFPLDCPGEYQ